MKNTFIRIATALPVALIATLAAVSTAQAAGTTIIDNTNQTSSEFALTGNWSYWSGQGYQSDVHNTGGSTGGNKKATYTFSVTPGEYRVSATWSVYYNRPTDAPYTIYDGATNLGTYRVNQKVAPDDFSDAGGTWEDLTTVTVTGDTLTVVLTDDVTSGDTIADAVRIEATGNSHRAFLFVDRQVQEDGTLTAEEVVKALIAFGKAFGASAGAPNFNAAADFDNSGAVNFGDFSFLVPVIENAGHNEIVKAFVYIDANSNFVLTQSEVNSAFERFSAVFGTNDSEADFNEDGLVDFGDFSYFAFVVNAAGLVDPNQTVFIIDNTKQSSSEFALTGNWGYWTGQGYEGDVSNSQGTTGGNKKATYTFAVAPGTYRVSTTWSVYYNRPENAPYTLYDGATNLGTYRVNQKVQPDDFSDAGGTWEDLATVTVTGDTLTVVLTDDVSAGKDVIADAVRVEKVENPRQLGDVNNDGYITYTDIQLVTEHLDGTSLLSDADRPYADANQNGKIEATDAWLIGLKSALLIELPAFYGDMDGDLQVQADDTVTVQRIIEGTVTPTAAQEALADVNRDDVIDAKDVELIQAYIGQTIPELPYFCGNLTEEASPPAAECNETTAQLFVREKSIGTTDTAVTNEKNILLARYEVRATEEENVVLSKIEFTAADGDTRNIQEYALFIDTDDNGSADTRLGTTSADVHTGLVTFEKSSLNGFTLEEDRDYIIEVRGDVVQGPLTDDPQLRLSLNTAAADYMAAYVLTQAGDEGIPLRGVETNAVCPEDSCQIHVVTTQNGSVLWSFVSQGSLYVEESNIPVRHRQILGGKISEAVLRLTFTADNEPVEVTDIQLTDIHGSDSIDRLQLFFEGASSKFADATIGGCASDPVPSVGVTYCANMESSQLVVPEGGDIDVLVRAYMKTDEQGAGTNEPLQLSLASSNAVRARGYESSEDLLQNDGDTDDEGEVFIGTDVPGAHKDIVGTEHVTVLSKVVSITNANPDVNGSAVPVGISAIGQFTFTAAQHNNTKHGVNDVILSDVIFTLGGQNVLVDPTSFTMFNKAQNNETKRHACELLNADGSSTGTASTVVSGSMYIRCTDLVESLIDDTEIDEGTSETFVISADILNPNTSTTGEVSVLQVSLQRFEDFSLSGTFGVQGSHIQWKDADTSPETSAVFQWMEYPETEVKSTAYMSN